MRTNGRILVDVLFVTWVLGNIVAALAVRNVYCLILSAWCFPVAMGLISLCSRQAGNSMTGWAGQKENNYETIDIHIVIYFSVLKTVFRTSY